MLPYVITLATYFAIYNILTWGLNIQFGYAGIPNFTYITFMATGAYIAGVVDLPKSSDPQYVKYILGLGWPWPTSLLLGGLAAGALGLLVGVVTLNGRLRSTYLAIVTFSLGFIAYDVVSGDQSLFNGFNGIAGISEPLNNYFHFTFNAYQEFFLGLAVVIMALLWLVANRIYNSPIGRTMRAIREDLDVAEALGKNTFKFRMIAIGIGCFYAGVGGALTIEFIGAFNPSGFSAPETFIIWTALLIGGQSNNLGVVVGSFIVPVLLFELTRFLPTSAADAQLIENGRFMLIGVMLIAILWFRPEGILRERKRRYYEIPVGSERASQRETLSRVGA
jgi:ABC-type branched-subunit amino acid transport system permease subunit